jgi:hypothetical protein
MAMSILKVAHLLAPISFLFKPRTMANSTISTATKHTSAFSRVLVGKLKRHRTFTGSAANPVHATATAMHFLANAGLIFLMDELTNDRYLVDTAAKLSIVP